MCAGDVWVCMQVMCVCAGDVWVCVQVRRVTTLLPSQLMSLVASTILDLIKNMRAFGGILVVSGRPFWLLWGVRLGHWAGSQSST